jgi:zinc finger SWIM domain-containing protein 3
LTDEDVAMATAIKIALLETHHRICVWHMNQNACKHLSGVVEEYKKFNTDFQSCIYDQEEEGDFINAWNSLLDKYKLRANDRHERLFKKGRNGHWYTDGIHFLLIWLALKEVKA